MSASLSFRNISGVGVVAVTAAAAVADAASQGNFCAIRNYTENQSTHTHKHF